VGRGLPFQSTTEPETNPVPVTVKVKLGPAGAMAEGAMGFRNGTGLGGSGADLSGATKSISNNTTAPTLRVAKKFISNSFANSRGLRIHNWPSPIANCIRAFGSVQDALAIFRTYEDELNCS
jgi:hypothetical protein